MHFVQLCLVTVALSSFGVLGTRAAEQNQTNPRAPNRQNLAQFSIFTRKSSGLSTKNLTDSEMRPRIKTQLSSLPTTDSSKDILTEIRTFVNENRSFLLHQANRTKHTFIQRLKKFHNVLDSIDNFDATFRLGATVDEDEPSDTESKGFVARLAGWMFSKPSHDEHKIRRRRNAQDDEDVGRSHGTETEAEEEIIEYIEEQKQFNWTHHWVVCSTIIIVWVCWFVIAIGLCRQAASMSKKAALMNEA